MERVDKILSRLGYATRSEVPKLIRSGRVCHKEGVSLTPATKIYPSSLLFNNNELEAPNGLYALFHKPEGFVCSHDEGGNIIYSLLPSQWQNRNPKVSSIGRLDKETTGILLLSDDGQLAHKLLSPKNHVPKVYTATLERPFSDKGKELFESGTLLLRGEEKPCIPADVEILSPFCVRVTLYEGRYHQIRRMFAAVGTHVTALHRNTFGSLTLGTLQLGEWRLLTAEEIQQLTKESYGYPS